MKLLTMNILLAANYWNGFLDYWSRTFAKQDSIILAVIGAGAVGIFIITRGKWKK